MKTGSIRLRFLLPLTAVLVAATVLSVGMLGWSTSQRVHERIERTESATVREVLSVLGATDSLVTQQVNASMRLLRERALEIGTPNLGAPVTVAGTEASELFLGLHGQANNFDLVDSVTGIMGGTATVFSRQGEDYIRIATNVKKDDGSRAIGTKLAPEGKAMARIRAGEAFRGQVDILGHPYITAYEPILADGQPIGIWYVGYRADMQQLASSLAGSRVLETGFAALVDDKGRVRYHSEHVTPEAVSAFLASDQSDWEVRRGEFAPWGYTVIVAVPQSEIASVVRSEVLGGVAGALIFMVVLGGLCALLLERLVLRPLGGEPAAVVELVKAVAEGDLTRRVPPARAGSLLAAVGEMQRGLRNIVTQISELAAGLENRSTQLAEASSAVSNTVNQQNQLTTDVSGTLQGITLSVGQIADSAQTARDKASEAGRHSESSAQVVGRTVEGMRASADSVAQSAEAINALSESSREISRIVGVISEIAEQTNMLALNAAIEAARAGEQGRGFAVVADEVRKLAERTASSTEEITEMIAAVQSRTDRAMHEMNDGSTQVRNSVGLANEAGETMGTIRGATEEVAAAIRDISDSLDEQRAATEQIAQGVAEISAMNERSAQSVSDVVRTTVDLQGMARDLHGAAGRFRL